MTDTKIIYIVFCFDRLYQRLRQHISPQMSIARFINIPNPQSTMTIHSITLDDDTDQLKLALSS